MVNSTSTNSPAAQGVSQRYFVSLIALFSLGRRLTGRIRNVNLTIVPGQPVEFTFHLDLQPGLCDEIFPCEVLEVRVEIQPASHPCLRISIT